MAVFFTGMKTKLTALVLGAFVVARPGTALAATRENPFQAICARNPFALRAVAPPPEPVPEQRPAPSPWQFFLTGVSSLPGVPVAILEFTDPQTKKTHRPPPLRAGETYNGRFTVTAIDVERGSVRIRQDGADTLLDFEKNGIKERTPAPAPPPPAVIRNTAPVPLPPSNRRGLVSGVPWPAIPSPAVNREPVRSPPLPPHPARPPGARELTP